MKSPLTVKTKRRSQLKGYESTFLADCQDCGSQIKFIQSSGEFGILPADRSHVIAIY